MGSKDTSWGSIINTHHGEMGQKIAGCLQNVPSHGRMNAMKVGGEARNWKHMGLWEAEKVQLSSKERILLDVGASHHQESSTSVKEVLDGQWVESMRGERTERVWSVRWGG